jgi:hypothetical protein
LLSAWNAMPKQLTISNGRRRCSHVWKCRYESPPLVSNDYSRALGRRCGRAYR